jgi:hypothetical protein
LGIYVNCNNAVLGIYVNCKGVIFNSRRYLKVFGMVNNSIHVEKIFKAANLGPKMSFFIENGCFEAIYGLNGFIFMSR